VVATDNTTFKTLTTSTLLMNLTDGAILFARCAVKCILMEKLANIGFHIVVIKKKGLLYRKNSNRKKRHQILKKWLDNWGELSTNFNIWMKYAV